MTGYGHWLPNDPRGSGSTEVRKDDLKDLGEVHFGRKRVQPPRDELRSFFRVVEPKLEHPMLWFDAKMRTAIADGFRRAIAMHRYSVWSCAILRNHAHLVVRTHKNRSEEMWDDFAREAKESLRAFAEVPPNHPVWSHRPYKVFLITNDEICGRIRYVNENPIKERLIAQNWDFVKPFKPTT